MHRLVDRKKPMARCSWRVAATAAMALLCARALSSAEPWRSACWGRAGATGGGGRLAHRAGAPDPRVVTRAQSANGVDGMVSEATLEWRQEKPTEKDQSWPFWPALPIAPYERRKTVRRELIPGQLWSFEQKQGIYYVHVPIRMTVFKMKTRQGLFVYAPVAPTEECVRLLKELEDQHGQVAYIVLPTVAVEHKYFVGPFARAFAKAEVWVCPGQFSVPPAPLELLGFPGERTRVLPKDPTSDDGSLPKEWRQEGFDYRVLGPIGKDLPLGFAEVVFYIRPLKTMLVTDLVLSVPTEIPEIIAEDPRGLVFHGRDGPLAMPEASAEAMARGWKRMVIFALMFGTTAIETQDVLEATRDAFRSPALDLGWSGYLPCNYAEHWEETFEALLGPGGRGGLLVPPILSELVLNRYLTSDVWPFVESVARDWGDMELVVPAHFEAPVAATAEEWRSAFRRAFGEPPKEFFGVKLPSFLSGAPLPGPQPKDVDLEFIRKVSEFFTFIGAVDPPERLTYLAGLRQDVDQSGRK